MRLGGNQAVQEWLTSKGAPAGASIKDKYNTPAAELYRLRLAAMRDGQPVPIELPAASLAAHAKQAAADGAAAGETPLEREYRLRAEAKERMRSKFGDGGLRGNAVSSQPLPAHMYDEGGSGAGALPVDPDEVKRKAAEALASASAALSSLSMGVSQKFNEVATEDTVKDVKAKAAEGWGMLASTASSLWSSVHTEYLKASGDVPSLRPQTGGARAQDETPEERAEREAAELRLRQKFGSQGLKGAAISGGGAPGGAPGAGAGAGLGSAAAGEAPGMDDEAVQKVLREREEAKERLRLKFGSGGLKGVAVNSGDGAAPPAPPASAAFAPPRPPSAASNLSSDSLASAHSAPVAVRAATPPQQQASTPPPTSEASSGRASPLPSAGASSSKKPPQAVKKKPVADDFFADFGV